MKNLSDEEKISATGVLQSKDGGVLRVHAAKRPTGKTLEALQDLFDAAYRVLSERQRGGRWKGMQ